MNSSRELSMAMLENLVELLKEDIECFHMAADDAGLPRGDAAGTYSMWGRVLACVKDSVRMQYLTDDLKGDQRKHRNKILDGMSVMSYSAACADIDAAITRQGGDGADPGAK